MKRIKHLSKTFCVAGAVLLFCFGVRAQAEKPLPRVDPKIFTKPAAQATPPADGRPAQRPPLTPESNVTKDDQRPIIKDLAKGLREGVSGEVRWRKEYGLPYNSSNDGRPLHPFPCQVFRVRATVAVINKTRELMRRTAAVGTFSGEDFGRAGTPAEEGGYYVCHFTIDDLPLDRSVNVMAEIDPSFLPPDYKGFDRSVRLTAPWIGGAEAQPPSGQQRNITGNTSVTLTAKAPRGKVVFEMVYAQ